MVKIIQALLVGVPLTNLYFHVGKAYPDIFTGALADCGSYEASGPFMPIKQGYP